MADEPASQRNGTGQFVATEETAERDALILRMLAQGMSYADVVAADLPGIANRGCVSKARRRRALDAIRSPAVEEYRAVTLASLDALESGAWEDVRNPGPKTSVTGTVVVDPQTGQPLPDKAVRDQARNTVLRTVRLRMDLLGLAAPKRSMNLQATMELDSENESLQAQISEAYAAALAERDREVAELRAQLAAQAPAAPQLALVPGKDGAA